ncbi:heme utilization protein [Bifidobacterium pullorum subsp. saeculare]|uniref:heme utilization protein n=1 Tax=Bifidobacterium pullorum TaxID=78448 RepID=UPI001956EC9A|nr:heme utilization protein [Bifidobacterium pullorum]MBM6706872.1 heme utilization protein [Bifidobacterium pullorum subsp. saeculare]
MVKELTAPAVLQTAGVSLGIGVGAAAVLALLGTIFLMVSANSAMSPLSSLASDLGSSLPDDWNMVQGANFFQIFTEMLVAGVSGAYSLNASAMGFSFDSVGSASLTLPFGLSGVALLVGAAFGAYMFARKNTVRFKWTGIISAAAVGLVTAIVYLILAAIFPIRISVYDDIASVSMSGATFRTFLMAFLTAGVGALAGYALAQYAPDSGNVFVAAWRWMHRTRGFVRTLAESAMVYTVVFTVVGVIVLIALAIYAKQPVMLLSFTLMFPLLPIMAFVLGAFGSMDTVSMMEGTAGVSVFSDFLGNYRWAVVAIIVVFVVTTFYIALRASARNMYDSAYADWKHSWKSPVAALVVWLVLTWGVAILGLDAHASGESISITFAPAMWFFLLAAVWAFLVDVVALTFGPTLVVSMPGMWHFFVGGTVQATPQNVTDYVDACGARFGRGKAGAATAAAAGMAGMAAGSAPTPPMPAQGAPAPGTQSTAPTTVLPTPGAVTQTFVPPEPVAQTVAGAPAVPPATPVAAPAAAPTVPPAIPPVAPVPAQHKPLTHKQKMGLIIGGIVVAVIAVLAIAYAVLNATVFSPKTVAEDYVSAIAGGNYSEANQIANPQLDKNKSALLTDKAAQAENATISNARVVSVTDADNGSKTANITYTIHGATVNDTFTVSPAGTKFLIFPNWTVSTPLTKTISVNAGPATDLTINGVDVTEDNATDVSADYGSTVMTFTVYPGTYRIAAAESKFIESDTATVSTDQAGDGTDAILDVNPTDDLTQALQDELDAQLQTCAASTDGAPDDCPFSFWGADDDGYRNFAWSITEFPEIDAVSLSDGSFSTGSYGEAKVTFERQRYDDSWEPDDYESSFSVYGTFEIDGDTVTITEME